MGDPTRTDFSRVFLIENRAGPANAPSYQGLWKAGALSWDQGDVSPVYIPDPDSYGRFRMVDKIPGEPGNPELPITSRYSTDLSTLLRMARNGCDHDLQVHMGKCRDPRDFNNGWDKVLVLEAARITKYGSSELGALQPSERAVVTEEVPFSGEDAYEVKRLTFSKQAESQIVQEIVDVIICDSKTCGLCGLPSDGCQIVLALTKTAGGSPGLPAEIVFTDDGGATWDDSNISTLAANEEPDAMACIGENTVVVSNDSCSLHYAPTADILAGTETWAEVATGFACAAGAPNDIFSLSPSQSWIVGDGGYIYKTEDPTQGVTVQDAGSATVQNLNAIHGYDELNLVAVGASNAVVHTANGGDTWESITGPAVGVALNTVWVRSKEEWWIGTAGGKLYYTRDSGQSWTEKTFSGSGAGNVADIVFVTPTVGYMAHATAANVGRILRTINGGYSWYVLPEGSATMPTNSKINSLAVCEDANLVWGGGEATVGGDGVLVQGA